MRDKMGLFFYQKVFKGVLHIVKEVYIDKMEIPTELWYKVNWYQSNDQFIITSQMISVKWYQFIIYAWDTAHIEMHFEFHDSTHYDLLYHKQVKNQIRRRDNYLSFCWSIYAHVQTTRADGFSDFGRAITAEN